MQKGFTAATALSGTTDTHDRTVGDSLFGVERCVIVRVDARGLAV
jgi:hypothetical protein